jgi:hypothetical protein
MKPRFVTLTLLAFALATAPALAVTEEPGRTPMIQIALLLDTSNSMDGLIDQAKAQLWSVVNEFVTAKREGVRPEFRVALYQYGNDGLNAETGYVQQLLPLTDDLDKVSEVLFGLTTNGGSEFCGTVIDRAADNLTWSPNHNDLKAVFIAGNEPFTQGNIDFKVACKKAIGKGVVINTIFCGPYEKGVEGMWKQGALLADGVYMNIDQNQQLTHIDAPQDAEIVRLGEALNGTYIPYGTVGQAGAAAQMEQDSNAMGISRGVIVKRQVTKASAFYRNTKWDLVDALEEETVDLEDVPKEGLPEELRSLSDKELEAYVAEQSAERAKIQEKINQLNTERKKHIAAELKKRGEDDDSLGAAVIQAVRKQAEAKQFKFEE